MFSNNFVKFQKFWTRELVEYLHPNYLYTLSILLFFTGFKLVMFSNNFVKFQKFWTREIFENLHPNYLYTLSIFA